MSEPQVRVLLVGGPADTRLLQEQLSVIASGSLEIVCVDRLDKALKRLCSEPFNIVLLNLSVPDKHGIEIIRLIRGEDAHIPIVWLSRSGQNLAKIEILQDAPEFMVESRDNPQAIWRVILYAILRERNEKSLRESEERCHNLSEELERMVEGRTADLEQRSMQLRNLAVELTHAEERERKRLAQALHDDLQQLLVAAKFCASTLADGAQNPALKESAQQLDQFLREAIESARSLSFELSPPVLYDLGLAKALHYLGRRMEGKYNLAVTVRADEKAEPESEEIKVLLFQSARELLFNVVKHANVKTADVEMRRLKSNFVQITVSDSGAGFDPGKCSSESSQDGFGLFSIRGRLDLAGGHLEIKSVPGGGSRCTMVAPLVRTAVVQRPAWKTATVPQAKPKGGLMRAGHNIPIRYSRKSK